MIARSLQDVKPQPTSSGMCARCVGFRDVLGQHRPQMVDAVGSRQQFANPASRPSPYPASG